MAGCAFVLAGSGIGMPKKFSISEKWNDPWFRKLDPASKCLFVYLCDVCDCAGFVEFDPEMVEFQTKLPSETLEGALKGLNPKVVSSGCWVWVVNHIKHQQDYPNKPLNPANKAHQGIWSRLNAHLDIEEVAEFVGKINRNTRLGFKNLHKEKAGGATKGLTSPTGKGNSNGKGKGKGKSIPDFFADFRDVHGECGRVTEQEFVAACAAERHAGLDDGAFLEAVSSALADFRLNCASMTSFRPQSAVQKWRNYLKNAVAKKALAAKPKKKRLRPHMVEGMK